MLHTSERGKKKKAAYCLKNGVLYFRIYKEPSYKHPLFLKILLGKVHIKAAPEYKLQTLAM